MAVWTDWDPLEEIIVGDIPPPSYFARFLDDEVMSSLEVVIRETKEDLDRMDKMLTDLGVKVYRPNILDFGQNLNLPGFKIKNPIAPIVPRDQYLVHGDRILQSYTSMADRWLEGLCFYDIFREKFDEGYNWLSVPPPLLKNFPPNTAWFTEGYERYNIKLKNQLLWHAATMYKAGDKIITNTFGPGTQKGLEWFRRQVDAEVIPNNGLRHKGFGHIDQFFFMVNDTTCYCTEEAMVPQIIRDNPNITVKSFGHLITDVDVKSYDDALRASDGKYTREWIDEWLAEWRGFSQEVAFDSNVVVIDEKNILVSNHQPKLEEYFASEGITLHPVNLRQGGFWDGGVHCLTLDIKRRGESRNVLG